MQDKLIASVRNEGALKLQCFVYHKTMASLLMALGSATQHWTASTPEPHVQQIHLNYGLSCSSPNTNGMSVVLQHNQITTWGNRMIGEKRSPRWDTNLSLPLL